MSQEPEYRCDAATPVLAVADVARTMAWYQDVLGFSGNPFPDAPPHAFAILQKGRTEVMLRQLCAGESAPGPSAGLDVYVRVGGQTLPGLWGVICGRGDVEIVEPWCKRFYGDTEFTIRDCDGRLICLSEYLCAEGVEGSGTGGALAVSDLLAALALATRDVEAARRALPSEGTGMVEPGEGCSG